LKISGVEAAWCYTCFATANIKNTAKLSCE